MYAPRYMLDCDDIVSRCVMALSKPLQEHWVAAKHVLRYLKGTLDYELCYRKCSEDLKLIGYSDADWASSTHDRRSISGYCFSLTETGLRNNGPWRSHLVKLNILLWQQQFRKLYILYSC